MVYFKFSSQEYLITKKFLKSCGHYLITIVIEVERNNLEPFRFNVIENKPLKSDNELNLHFSDKDICQRRGKSDNTVNNETIVNNTTDLPIEQADENSSEKAPEHSSEKPLEKTHQDLKVKPVKLLKFIYSEKAAKFCEIFTLLLSYM